MFRLNCKLYSDLPLRRTFPSSHCFCFSFSFHGFPTEKNFWMEVQNGVNNVNILHVAHNVRFLLCPTTHILFDKVYSVYSWWKFRYFFKYGLDARCWSSPRVSFHDVVAEYLVWNNESKSNICFKSDGFWFPHPIFWELSWKMNEEW